MVYFHEHFYLFFTFFIKQSMILNITWSAAALIAIAGRWNKLITFSIVSYATSPFHWFSSSETFVFLLNPHVYVFRDIDVAILQEVSSWNIWWATIHKAKERNRSSCDGSMGMIYKIEFILYVYSLWDSFLYKLRPHLFLVPFFCFLLNTNSI